MSETTTTTAATTTAATTTAAATTAAISKDEEEEEQQIQQQTLTVCPKCNKLGRIIADKENTDQEGYFDVRYWHPDTDKECYISRAIGLERAISNEIKTADGGGGGSSSSNSTGSTTTTIITSQPNMPANINPVIYKEFITQAKQDGLTEVQAWDAAMHAYLRISSISDWAGLKIDTNSNSTTTTGIAAKTPHKLRRKPGRPYKQPQVEPIPVPIQCNGICLKDFYKSKLGANPKVHYDIMAVFTYYISEIAKIKDPTLGHIAYCYEHVDRTIPSLIDLAKNSARYKKTLRQTGKYGVYLTPEGKNFVEAMEQQKGL